MTTTALLAGTPAAFAATATAGRPTTLTTPDAFKWLKYGPYPTQHACKVEGDQIIFKENSSYIFKCVEQTKGDYFIWELYIGVPE
ncbi:MAG: hypothetical protein WAK82_14920 [Streptosporangiaceae bacterium]